MEHEQGFIDERMSAIDRESLHISVHVVGQLGSELEVRFGELHPHPAYYMPSRIGYGSWRNLAGSEPDMVQRLS